MTGAVRYVATNDIKSALVGRESDVLQALRIQWQAGRPHVKCPYRDHADG